MNTMVQYFVYFFSDISVLTLAIQITFNAKILLLKDLIIFSE